MTKLIAIAAAAAALATAFAVAPVAAQDIPDIVIPLDSTPAETTSATVGLGAPGVTNFGMSTTDSSGNGGAFSVTPAGGATLGVQAGGFTGTLSDSAAGTSATVGYPTGTYSGSVTASPGGTTVNAGYNDGTYSGGLSTGPVGTTGNIGYSSGGYTGGLSAGPGSVGATFGVGF